MSLRKPPELSTVRQREPPSPAREAPFLRVTSAVGACEFDPGLKVELGRRAGCAVRVDDPLVSGSHAQLEATPEGVRVIDLQSTNGTWYAGARVREALVPSGAQLQVGGTTVRVELGVKVVSGDGGHFGDLRGRSAVMRTTIECLRRLAPTEIPVLLQGESGTGKGQAARLLHEHGPRAGRVFLKLDCASLPPTLAESELFGHCKGAFTGADRDKPGIFEAAHGGTVFIDEIGDLPLDLQPRLLRVLEDRVVVRLGEHRPRPVDVRILSATLRDLRVMVNERRFREDLYYRLAYELVGLPSLHERREDIPELVGYFLAHPLHPNAPWRARAIEDAALERMRTWEYRGNVRELRADVESLAQTAGGEIITDEHAFGRERVMNRRAALPPLTSPTYSDAIGPFKEAKKELVDRFERDYLSRLLHVCDGNLSKAALLAGIDRNHLRLLCVRRGLRAVE